MVRAPRPRFCVFLSLNLTTTVRITGAGRGASAIATRVVVVIRGIHHNNKKAALLHCRAGLALQKRRARQTLPALLRRAL